MTKYYSTVTQTDQAGDPPADHTNHHRKDTGPNPSTTNPNEQSDAVPRSRPTLQGQETQDSGTRDDA
jgi:hypothetical protein